jgi:hypothetical protein
MGIFDNLKEAKVFENGRKLPPGDHVVTIDKILMSKSARFGGDQYIVEFLVNQTTSAEIGGRYSWVQSSRDLNSAQGAIKQFVLAVLKADKDKAPEHYAQVVEQCEALAVASCGNDQIFKGQKVRVSNQIVKTKSNYDFNRHNWTPYVEATA